MENLLHLDHLFHKVNHSLEVLLLQQEHILILLRHLYKKQMNLILKLKHLHHLYLQQKD
jgi:hypothetical protein